MLSSTFNSCLSTPVSAGSKRRVNDWIGRAGIGGISTVRPSLAALDALDLERLGPADNDVLGRRLAADDRGGQLHLRLPLTMEKGAWTVPTTLTEISGLLAVVGPHLDARVQGAVGGIGLELGRQLVHGLAAGALQGGDGDLGRAVVGGDLVELPLGVLARVGDLDRLADRLALGDRAELQEAGLAQRHVAAGVSLEFAARRSRRSGCRRSGSRSAGLRPGSR